MPTIEDQKVETYKGVRIYWDLQTHTEYISPYLGYGHVLVKNPDYRPQKPLQVPLYHVGSPDVVTTDTASKDLETAIKRYKEKVDDLLAAARWKEAHGYSDDLYKASEKFILNANRNS